MIRLAVLIEHQLLTDGQMESQNEQLTDGHTVTAYGTRA